MIAAGLAAASLVAGSVAVRSIVRRMRRIELQGKVVAITGGSRGLGLALARRFADKGCRVALCARDEDELSAALGELIERGAEVMTLRCDVRDPAQVERFVAAVEQRFGGIDVLVTNAGTIQVGPLTAMSLHDFRDAMDGIFWGSVHATLAVLPGMRRRGWGHIVHISSVGGRVPVPHLAPYTTAKFALTGFSEAARSELNDEGIDVLTVAPGLMRTGSQVNAEFKGQAGREFSWFALSGLLPRLGPVDPDEAARQIIGALEERRAQVTLWLPSRLASLAHGVAPGLFTDLMSLVDRTVMPRDDGRGHGGRVRGEELRDEAPAIAVQAIENDGAEFGQDSAGAGR